MDPLTAGAIAVGTIVATKILEKTTDKATGILLDKAGNFLVTLKKHSPHTVVAIEKAPQEPLDYGKAALEVESAAKANPEVNLAVQELVTAAKVDSKVASIVQELLKSNLNHQSGNVINNTKLADEIKNVFQGNTIIGGNF